MNNERLLKQKALPRNHTERQQINGITPLFMMVLLVSSLSCQFISNVPSAILLSNFTTSYPLLLVGVNIGGVGTLISSLASLITYREYSSRYPKDTKKYLLEYSAISFSFLLILILFNLLIYSS